MKHRCRQRATDRVLVIAYKGPRVLKLINGFDYSYGIYIYAFPVQQTFAQLVPSGPLRWLNCLVLSVIVTVVFAALSWHFIERPALALKSRLVTSRRSEPVRASDDKASRVVASSAGPNSHSPWHL